MIQRKQTIYFLIGLILVLLPLLGTAFFSISTDAASIKLFSFDAFHSNIRSNAFEKKYFWIGIVITGLFLLITIFSYKDRKRQITLAWLAFTLNVAVSFWIVIEAFSFKKLHNVEGSSLAIEFGFFIFASAFLFIFLGIQGVRKDKALIDSLNRLR